MFLENLQEQGFERVATPLSLTQQPMASENSLATSSRPRSAEKNLKSLKTVRTLQDLLKLHDTPRLVARAKSNYSQNYEIWSIEAAGF